MESIKLFNQVFDNFPAVHCLKIWNNSNGFKLIGWHTRHIYVCSLTNEQILNPMESSKIHCCYEELMSSEDIVDVFCLKEKCFILDSQCFLLEMVQEAVHDMEWEGDLFEDTPKEVLKSYLKKKYRVNEKSTLQAACFIPEESFACLINTTKSVIVKIINFNTHEETKCITIRSSPLLVTPQHHICLMLFVPGEYVEVSYVRNWFPEVLLDNFESGLLVISLPDSIICGVLLDENQLIPHFMFSWPFQALQAHWFCTECKEPNRISRQSNLILVFDGGTVVILEQYGGKTAYMPLNSIKNAFVSPDFIVITDYFDCYSSKTFETDKITNLPLKGVLGFCTIPEQKHIILASTRHRTLYAINLNAEIANNRFKMPGKDIFDEFLRRNKYLEQLNKQIEETDNYINALSYSLNNSLMKFSFSAQVVLIAGQLHTFRMIVKSENPKIIFRNTIWKLHLSLFAQDCCYTYVRDLEHDLTVDNPFIDFLAIECIGNYWDYHVDAYLICYIGKDKYRPNVNIGSILMDISHFIQPASSLKLYQSHVERDVNINEILENINSREYSQQNQNINFKKNEEKNYLCSFEVPINEELSNDCVVKKLLTNSRALWRAKEWQDTCKKAKFQILIAGNLFNIEIRKGSLIITGKHVESCHSLKVAAIELLNKNFTLNIDNTVRFKVEELLKSLELVQFNTDDSVAIKRAKTLTIYKQLKENIIFSLTGVKMNLTADLFETKKYITGE